MGPCAYLPHQRHEEGHHQGCNYDKMKEITSGPGKDPALFLSHLSEALCLFTNSDLTSEEGKAILAICFISQPTSSTCGKLQNLREGPSDSPVELRDQYLRSLITEMRMAERERDHMGLESRKISPNAHLCNQSEAPIRLRIVRGPPTATRKTITGPRLWLLLQRQTRGHWSQDYQERLPTGPCPLCELTRH